MAEHRSRDDAGSRRIHGTPPSAISNAEATETLAVVFDLTVVHGAEGRRLAVLQAQAIIAVLTWLHEQAQRRPRTA
ncbi:MAG: hypothetical protein HKP61_20295 [Dactylosporangium sp.]|nr:hypothetical protein [Dactylosporangium sp.]NNJ63225.1 hypothetical protein [Dactylosporangium sp.]